MTKVVTPKVVSWAKKHFNCSTIDGVYLEDEGGESTAAAHFEKLLFGNDYMTGEDNGNPILSGLTLAFMEDTGWYKVDYSVEETLYWGKNKGCKFYLQDCGGGREFCTNPGEIACSEDYQSKT